MSTFEIRDAVHVFVRLDGHERAIVDSWPLQRLRHVHQLALTDRVYPGATHSRFEHSLGTMELAGRVFDIVTRADNLTDEVRRAFPQLRDPTELAYWRRVLRVAALCHDIGHPPYSHAAEKALYPTGWNHERMTRLLLESEPLCAMLGDSTPPLRIDDVVKLAVGPAKATGLSLSNWEAILSEIIVGDAFGVDRMDYLLRDSLHAGVVYGRFDQDRLIDTLRILPAGADATEFALGIEHGGLHTAEALLLARYFMYSQVYFHAVRMVLDLHLIDFLRAWLPGGGLPTETRAHLALTDDTVFSAMQAALLNEESALYVQARRILGRHHFRVLHQISPDDRKLHIDPAGAIATAAVTEFGAEHILQERRFDQGGSVVFPVRQRDGSIGSSLSLSVPLRELPPISADYIFVSPDQAARARTWLLANRTAILAVEEAPHG